MDHVGLFVPRAVVFLHKMMSGRFSVMSMFILYVTARFVALYSVSGNTRKRLISPG